MGIKKNGTQLRISPRRETSASAQESENQEKTNDRFPDQTKGIG
jgi:hypothetical protein